MNLLIQADDIVLSHRLLIPLCQNECCYDVSLLFCISANTTVNGTFTVYMTPVYQVLNWTSWKWHK